MINLKEKKEIFLKWVEWGDRQSFLEFCREVNRNYRTVRKIIDECINNLAEMSIDINDVETIRKNIDTIVTQTPYPPRPSKINEELIEIIRGELRAQSKKRNLLAMWEKLRKEHGEKKMVSYNVFINLAKRIENDEL